MEDAVNFVETEIGAFPESWTIKSLGELFDVQQGKALSQRKQTGILLHPFLRTINVLWGKVDLKTIDYMDFTREEVQRLSLKPDDLLICEGGEIGRSAVWSQPDEGICYQNHVHRLRRKNEEIAPDFVMYWMQAAFLLLRLYGGIGNKTTIPNLSGNRLKQLLIPVPPLSEQRGIAAVLAKIQAAVEVQNKIVVTLKELKAVTMNKLFRGGTVNGLMFDSNIFDAFVDGKVDLDSLPKGLRIYITHIQQDELNSCSDDVRRQNLQKVLVVVSKEELPTESFVLGVSRLDCARLGDGRLLEELRGNSFKKTNDALIAETAINNALVLVTNDKNLRANVLKVGGESITSEDLLAGRLRPTKQTEIGEMPESWNAARVGELVRFGSGASRPDDLSTDRSENTPFPVYGGNGVMGYSSQFLTAQESIVIGRVGAYCGSVHICPSQSWVTDNALYHRDPISDNASLHFLAELLSHIRLNRLQRKGAQPLVTQGTVHSVVIPLPQKPEQEEIAHTAILLNTGIETAEHKLNTLKFIFSAMLHLLMTGQLRIINLDKQSKPDLENE